MTEPHEPQTSNSRKGWLRRFILSWGFGWVHCPTCNAFISATDMGQHSDWHFRQEWAGAYERRS